MTLGIIGAGAIGQAVAKQALRAEISVSISNGRGPESLASLVRDLGAGARAVTKAEAAASEMVLLAVPRQSLRSALADLPPWEGRILIDATNALPAPGSSVAKLHGETSSELVRDLAPGARLVKAFNTLTPELLIADAPLGGRRAIFLSGDDREAKEDVSRMMDRMGFAAFDLGGLVEGGRQHQFPDGPLAAQNLVRFPMS